MPRQARLDIPGFVHHVMARGIEGREIFLSNKDRDNFLRRLAEIVSDPGGPTVYAWALLPNHFHLLIRPAETHLATVMQRLMTGYAIHFNRVHKRLGHLFQNRYKSIVVEEDPYFLQLVRYIHLNPIRAGIVKTLSDLKKYRYSGHSAILRCQTCAFQAVDDVLSQFSQSPLVALKAYEEFVAAGVDQGTRDDLRGGGLLRSAGGIGALLARGFGPREAGDERILGSGEFVESLWHRAETQVILPVKSVDDVLSQVCEETGIPKEVILGPSTARLISKARVEFYNRARQEVGVTYEELGRLTGRTHVAVSRAIDRARGKVH